jgi:PAS domain-containing protein
MKRFLWLADLPNPPLRGTGDSYRGETSFLLGSVGTDGKVRFLSQSWERILGHDPRQTPSRPLYELIPLERAIADRLVERLLDPGNSDPVEICLRVKDGGRKRFLWHRRFDPSEERMYIAGEEVAEREARK